MSFFSLCMDHTFPMACLLLEWFMFPFICKKVETKVAKIYSKSSSLPLTWQIFEFAMSCWSTQPPLCTVCKGQYLLLKHNLSP